MVDINSSLSLLGSFGLYQLYVYLMSCIPVINAGIVMLSLVFLTATPDHRCFVPNCDSTVVNPQYFEPFLSISIPKLIGSDISYNSCKRFAQINNSNNKTETKEECDINLFTNVTEECNSYVYDNRLFTSTVVTQFNKVCDQSWELSICQSLFYFGVLSGALLFGIYADRFGRQSVFKVAPMIGLSTALFSAFAPNFMTFTVSSAITAACIAGMYQTAFIIGIEFIGGQWRVWCGNLHSVLFAVGAVILCLMAYFIREWRQLQFVIAIPIAFTIFYPWLFPESVRWQTTNGETLKAIKTIRRAAKWNKVYIPEEYLNVSEELSVGTGSAQPEVKHYGPFDLIRNRITRIWTLNLFFIWFATSLVYYGLSFQSSDIGTNIYVTFGWLALVEIPAIIFGTIAMQIYGRKKVLFFLLSVGGLSCIAPVFLSETYSSYVTVFAVFGKSNIAAAFSLIYVYSVEIFPTVLRSSGLGMCSMCSRIGGILAPQLIELSVFGKTFPLLVSGIVSVIAGCLVIYLPETHNRRLPETLEDVKFLRDGTKHSVKIVEFEERDETVKLLNDFEN